MSEAPAPRRRSALLIISLCLNVVLVPLVAVIIYRAAYLVAEIGSGGVLAPRSVMAAVPAERERIQHVLDIYTPKIRDLRAAAVLARRNAFQVLGSSDYTAEKFARALDAVTAADAALERENIQMMSESLATLTPDERQKMTELARARARSWFWRLFGPRARRG
ncbi:MAG TPA: periplasmic heavy metal sensor [Rhizomicrobium sp.]|nr:periplasmic heavy metal sensor [Rhizomicrobium sp.]